MTEKDRLVKLAAFRNQMEEELGWSFDNEEFSDRLKMQKFVYLGESFGYDSGYNYNIYIHGPYSPELAEDYYKEEFEAENSRNIALDEFEADRFKRLVDGKDEEWLEYAATIKKLFDKYSFFEDNPRTAAIDQATKIKDMSKSTAEEIFAELKAGDAI